MNRNLSHPFFNVNAGTQITHETQNELRQTKGNRQHEDTFGAKEKDQERHEGKTDFTQHFDLQSVDLALMY